jgi:FtsP/CotA-like multicopper oxidase with cupredoxin domain
MAKNNQTRRNFLKTLGIGTGAVGAAMLNPAIVGAEGQESGHQETPPMQGDVAAEMDLHHEEGVQKFQEHIGVEADYWSRPIEFEMDGDVKVFTLTFSNIMWETEVGNPRPAMAYNGIVPGPTLRATVGERVRVIVNNEMDQSTSIHWHGLDIPNDQDGVPYLTQDVIKPGTSYTYEFTVPNAGSHMYHSHHNALEQVVGGLLEYEQDYVFILNDSMLGFTINGRGFPYTQPLTAKLGERIRVRFYNEGLLSHPMHLHGMPMRVIAKDGYNVPAPYLCDTLHIAPGERFDVIIQARAVGAWAFHCHILSHAESRNGMFGMVTALVITE